MGEDSCGKSELCNLNEHVMMLLLLTPLLLSFALPVFAEVDPRTHKLCLEAKDYQGCVRAMTGVSGGSLTVKGPSFNKVQALRREMNAHQAGRMLGEGIAVK